MALVATLPRDSTAPGATYEVAPSGSDSGDGSAARPWRTLKRGIEALHAGDTLLVHGGRYEEAVVGVDLRRGTPSARITVRAYPGERPVLSGLLSLRSASYWTLDGLDVTWGAASGADEGNRDHMIQMVGGEGWRIAHAEIWGARAYSALLIAGDASNWRVDHNVIRDTQPTHDENQDHLVYIDTPVSGGILERNLLAGSPNGRGVKIGPSDPGSSPVGGVTVRYNTVLDNTGPSNVQLSYGATGNRIYRNIFVGSAPGSANVTGYNLEGSDNEVADNVGWGSIGVLDPLTGLEDMGGNLHLDPRLTPGLVPAEPRAVAYGRLAPGDDDASAARRPTG